jgi:hypothetical protein
MTSLLAQLAIGVLLFGSVGFTAPPTAEQHCVVNVEGQKADGELITSQPRCFSRFSDAMDHATGGKVHLARSAQGSVMFEDAQVSAQASSYTIGIHYTGYNGTGSSITITGSDCNGGYWNATGYWVDNIRSSYNGCPVLVHCDEINLGGHCVATSPIGQIRNLGTLAGKVRSVEYTN